jgi:hypothetical protein
VKRFSLLRSDFKQIHIIVRIKYQRLIEIKTKVYGLENFHIVGRFSLLER